MSKRLAQLEQRLGAPLLNRTTRRASLTHEGEAYLQHARRILADIEAAEAEVQGALAEPTGLLRVNATLGFGRMHVAPLIASFVKLHPKVKMQLPCRSTRRPWRTTPSTSACASANRPTPGWWPACWPATGALLCAAPAFYDFFKVVKRSC